jgi:hypothetical protein
MAMAMALPDLPTEILNAVATKINWVVMPSNVRDTWKLAMDNRYL